MKNTLKFFAVSTGLLSILASVGEFGFMGIAEAMSGNVSTNTRIAASNMAFPVNDVLPKIKAKTQVPIFLPSQLSFSQKVYFITQADAKGYSVSINYTPDCKATACYMGAIEAEKGGKFTKPMGGNRETFKNIQLAKETKAIFFNGCGAYCTALVEWESGGVLYRVTMKNGKEDSLKQIANSAIETGRR